MPPPPPRKRPSVTRTDAFGDLDDVKCSVDQCTPWDVVPKSIGAVRAAVEDFRRSGENDPHPTASSVLARLCRAFRKHDRDVHAAFVLSLVFGCVVALVALTRRGSVSRGSGHDYYRRPSVSFCHERCDHDYHHHHQHRPPPPSPPMSSCPPYFYPNAFSRPYRR